MRSIRYLATALVAATVLGSAASASSSHTSAGHNAAGHPGDPKRVSRTVRIEAAEVKFDVQNLTFKTGETLKIVLVNKGVQDHELTIGDRAAQLEHRQEMQEIASMPDMDMAQMPSHGHGPKSAITVKPGETKELIWQFSNPGSFEFACNFPGHAEVGMAGMITVR